MPRTKTTAPVISRQKGQRSLDYPLYIDRIIPYWGNPKWMEGNAWRAIVAQQPVAVACRDTLISNIVALDWKIEPRDSTQRDELKSQIKYYDKFFQDTGDLDYVELIEWVGRDYLDLPFGGAVEVGRKGDSPEGQVMWMLPLDGATLFPDLNFQYPVGQTVATFNTVYFPKHAINRIYASPETKIDRKGWGCPPPEKIYLAIQLLNRGDVYYANLLLDTPQVGLLDLLDMSETSAKTWVDAWKKMLTGIDPFKIPVLYEHTKPAEFISFTHSPTELMFDKATAKYVILTCAAYGMSPSDIGFSPTSSGGETLAGTIRQERRTRKTGFAVFKRKLKYFFDRMLPDELEFKWIDVDDEFNVAVGRARLATATAIQLLIQQGVLTPNEGRLQMLADGLITVSIPETVEGGNVPLPPSPKVPQGSPNLLGRPIAPSQGGYGEVKSDVILRYNTENIASVLSIDNLAEEYRTLELQSILMEE